MRSDAGFRELPFPREQTRKVRVARSIVSADASETPELSSVLVQGRAAQRPAPPDDSDNPSVNFHGERRQNATHQSTTDPEARLAKKGAGKEAKLCYTESVLMENRNRITLKHRQTPAARIAIRIQREWQSVARLPSSRSRATRRIRAKVLPVPGQATTRRGVPL